MHREERNFVELTEKMPGKEDIEVTIIGYSIEFTPQFALVMPIQNEIAICDIISEIYHTMVKNNPYYIEVVISIHGGISKTREVIINLRTKFPLKASLSKTKRCYAVSIQDTG